MQLNCANKILDLSTPVVMGILNTTPDSFSDGGRYFSEGGLLLDSALRQAEKMCNDGALIIDVGGESTRPGAEKVSLDEELSRVVPVVEALVRELDVVVSVDSSSPQVMREAAAVGAGMLNDVRALQREGALQAAAETGLPVCLMHMQGRPETMQQVPSYDNVVTEVSDFLQQRIAACTSAGLPRERLLIDPGFGFGKTLAHNVALLRQLGELSTLGLPLLVGLSRKSMIGALLDREVDQRLAGSLSLALLSVQRGANIVRVHDVAETVDVLKLQQIIEAEQ